MALTKTITVSYQFKNNATAPSSVSFSAEPVVSGSNLVVGHINENPGVFTAGTPSQSYSTNVNDSNS